MEEEEENPLRSQGIATAAATPREDGIHGAGQKKAAWYQGERGPHPQARPDRQVGGQDLVAMIRREVGEQTTEIRKSMDELRSVQGCRQDAVRREEATTKGPKIVGSLEEREVRVEDAIRRVDGRSETLARKEEDRAGVEGLIRERVRRASSGCRTRDPSRSPNGALQGLAAQGPATVQESGADQHQAGRSPPPGGGG